MRQNYPADHQHSLYKTAEYGYVFTTTPTEGWVAAIQPDDQLDALHQWQQAVVQQRPLNAESRLRSPTASYKNGWGSKATSATANGPNRPWPRTGSALLRKTQESI